MIEKPKRDRDYGSVLVNIGGFRRVRYLSVSQLQSFDPKQANDGGCNRRWWFRRVAGKSEPTTKAQAVGTDGHLQIKQLLTSGIDALGPIARAGRHFIPESGLDLVVERDFCSPTIVDASPMCVRDQFLAGGVPVAVYQAVLRAHAALTVFVGDDEIPLVGASDLMHRRDHYITTEGARVVMPRNAVEVVDWKFVSEIGKWAKSPEALIETIQMPGYAELASRIWPDLEYFRVSHGYFQTGRSGRAADKRTTIFDLTVKRRRWHEVESTARSLTQVAREDDVTKVEPNHSACAAFGGCPHWEYCPRSSAQTIVDLFRRPDFAPRRRDMEESMGLLDRIGSQDLPQAFAAQQPAFQPQGQPQTFAAQQSSFQPQGLPQGQPQAFAAQQPAFQPQGQPQAFAAQQPQQPSFQPQGQPQAFAAQQPQQPSFQPQGLPQAFAAQQPQQPSFQPQGLPQGQPQAFAAQQPQAALQDEVQRALADERRIMQERGMQSTQGQPQPQQPAFQPQGQPQPQQPAFQPQGQPQPQQPAFQPQGQPQPQQPISVQQAAFAPHAPPPQGPSPALASQQNQEAQCIGVMSASGPVGSLCGMPITRENTSRLQDGRVLHVQCPRRTVPAVLPPDAPQSGQFQPAAQPVDPVVLAAMSPPIQQAHQAVLGQMASPPSASPRASSRASKCAGSGQVVYLQPPEIMAKRATCTQCGMQNLAVKPEMLGDKAIAKMPSHSDPRLVAQPQQPQQPQQSAAPQPSATQVQQPAGIDLYIDCTVSGAQQVLSLDAYIDNLARQIEQHFQVPDIRSAQGDHPLAFGRWRAVLSALARESAPPSGAYVVTHVAESEIKQTVVEALRPFCRMFVRAA